MLVEGELIRKVRGCSRFDPGMDVAALRIPGIPGIPEFQFVPSMALCCQLCCRVQSAVCCCRKQLSTAVRRPVQSAYEFVRQAVSSLREYVCVTAYVRTRTNPYVEVRTQGTQERTIFFVLLHLLYERSRLQVTEKKEKKNL